MKHLGNSDLEISPIGLGTWAIGGEGVFGWGPQDDSKSIAAIRRSVERGINWLDTAPIYGMGHSEKVVARALDEIGSASRPFVFTKCGLTWDDTKNVIHNITEASIRQEIEDSLQRLQIDVIDLYQIHWPAFPPGADAPDIEEAWSILADLMEKGKVRAIGVSNFDAAQLERAHKIAPIASLQPPYSALMRQIEDEVLPYCLDNNIGTIVYSPLHNGMLTGTMTRKRIEDMPESDWRKQVNPAFKEPHLTKSLQFTEVLRGVADRYGRSTSEVAIAWTLRHPAVTGAIVGARDAGQVDGFVDAMEFRLGDDDLAEIEAALPASITLL
ncbi:MAG: aldo/keto reductase [bacterium]|nr:aldo/keto reductase [bacterium]